MIYAIFIYVLNVIVKMNRINLKLLNQIKNNIYI